LDKAKLGCIPGLHWEAGMPLGALLDVSEISVRKVCLPRVARGRSGHFRELFQRYARVGERESLKPR